MNYDIIEATSFEEVLSEIEENSKYKRLPPKEKNWMTVPEMGNLLGLKKTGRYWLVQKNYFECREIAGQMRVNIASFEKWYANQVKYHKVNGEEPGKNLKKWSYSISEVAKMLGISETTVYDLIRRDGIKTVTVDYWIRIPKKSFQEWYEKQSKYRTQKDREKDKELEGATITMPEMARLLGIPRRQVYEILKNSKYSHFFETIEIAEKKRITKESFQKFLDGQDHYKLDPANDYEELSMEQNFSLANYRRKKLAKTGDRSKNGNLGYLTFDEAAFLAKVSRGMIYKWIDDGKFSTVKIGYISRVKRDEFEAWLKERERKGN